MLITVLGIILVWYFVERPAANRRR